MDRCGHGPIGGREPLPGRPRISTYRDLIAGGRGSRESDPVDRIRNGQQGVAPLPDARQPRRTGAGLLIRLRLILGSVLLLVLAAVASSAWAP